MWLYYKFFCLPKYSIKTASHTNADLSGFHGYQINSMEVCFEVKVKWRRETTSHLLKLTSEDGESRREESEPERAGREMAENCWKFRGRH